MSNLEARERISASGRLVREAVVLVATAMVIAFLIKTFVAQAFFIPSGSMIPQLKVGDRVVVSKLAYRLHDPHRGDIVVFDAPNQVAVKDDETPAEQGASRASSSPSGCRRRRPRSTSSG